MKCPKCQFENAEGIKFCGECAHDLMQETESSINPEHKPQSYTPKHLSDKILSSKSAIEGERKLVTVLFADVAGFTSMSEKLDPEDVHKIMDGCFKILMDKIHDYQGTINQFTGDGVMALFGAPLALEDHAQNACRAALSIQKALKSFGKDIEKRFGIKFQMRIGINSGPVVVGSIGDDLRMDYTAIGDTTNLAARMESMAEPGTVLVSSNTYSKVHQQFDLKSIGPQNIKGKEKPLAVYQLIKSKGHRPRLGLERQIFSEMVGRDKDLDRLELQVIKAVNGEGSVVNIIGEAGIGKSRLIAELKNREVIKKVALLEGRAISIGRNLSFHPIISLLKHWTKIKEDDDERTAFGKIEKAVQSVCRTEADEILPFIATLMGMKLSGRYAQSIEGIEGEALQKNILKNVKDLVTRAAEQTPLVILMEDLHWADTSSIELLESLFRLAETQRIIFVNVFRPDHHETGDRIIETLKDRPSVYCVEIRLQPLDEQMSEILINNMMNIKGLHHRIKDQVIQRSGGNPFFIEEVVRSFIDEGAVVNKNGVFEVTDQINQMVIPHTINDVLMARIDRLEEKTRNLLKIASVIGRNFFYRILSEVSSTIEDIEAMEDMDRRLSYLKEIQLIKDRKRLEELEYLFKHALAQEAAYESILLQKRKAIHLKVAESIEKVFKEKLHEFYGMLAFHYTQAEDEEKTEEYLIKAGEEALKSSASSEALHYFHEALNLYLQKYGDTADLKKVARLEKSIAHAYLYRGQFAEAIEYFDKVLAFYGWTEINLSPFGILKFLFKFSYLIAGLYMPFLRWKKTPTDQDSEINYLFWQKVQCLTVVDAQRMFVEGINHSKRVITFDISKMKKGVDLFCMLSCLFSWGGVSFRVSKKILTVVKDKLNKNDLYAVLNYEMNSFIHSYLSGDWEADKPYDEDLVNQNLKNIDLIAPTYLVFHALKNMEIGCYDDGINISNKISEIGNLFEHDYSIALKFTGFVLLLEKYRRLREALNGANEAINFISKTSFTLYLFGYHSGKARIQMMMGDIQEAEQTLRYANEIRSEIYPPPMFLGHYLRTHFIFTLYHLEKAIAANIASNIAKNRKAALKAGKKAVKNSQKVAFDRVETYKYMGTLYWLINKQKRALKWWAKSIKEGQRLNARPELSRTYFEVGKRLIQPQSKYKSLSGISAEEYLKKAEALFKEMGLQWDLDELAKIENNKHHD